MLVRRTQRAAARARTPLAVITPPDNSLPAPTEERRSVRWRTDADWATRSNYCASDCRVSAMRGGARGKCGRAVPTDTYRGDTGSDHA
jgi:hypothetical protein